MKLSIDAYEVLIQVCEDLDCQVRNDYSGRNMYGRKCIAIQCDSPLSLIGQILNNVRDYEDVDNEIEEIFSLFAETDIRTDNLGLDKLLYFPSVSVDMAETLA